MNRQALPSIILSVSIVCFFAIALYQRDEEPRKLAHRNVPAASGSIAPPQPGSPAPKPTGGQMKTPPIPAGPSAVVAGSAAPARPAAARKAPATVRSSDVPSETGPVAARARPNEAPVPAVRLASTRPVDRGTSRPPRTHEAESAPRPAGRLARAPFTVVGSGETMADVARRVYGNADDADSLWRANRDVVREPGAPLVAGTVLRTPAPRAR